MFQTIIQKILLRQLPELLYTVQRPEWAGACTLVKGSEDLISRCGHMMSNLPRISGDRGLSRCDTLPSPSSYNFE